MNWWWPSAEAWTAIFTGTLFFSTLALWYVTWRALRHAREDSERQARDAAKQLELANKQFVAAHRPNIIVRQIDLIRLPYPDNRPEGPPSILVKLVNTGTATAEIVRVELGFGVRGARNIKWREPTALTVYDAMVHKIVSGGFHLLEVNRERRPFSVDALAALEDKLFVWGEVMYRDELMTGRNMGFIRWYDAQFDRFQKLPDEWANSEMDYAE